MGSTYLRMRKKSLFFKHSARLSTTDSRVRRSSMT